VYELSQIESIKGVKEQIKKDFGFEPDFENAKSNLERNDGAGNTFKATAKPVLIGTAVVGATTMIFGIIIMLGKTVAADMAKAAALQAGAVYDAAVALTDEQKVAGINSVISSLSLVRPEVVLGLLMAAP